MKLDVRIKTRNITNLATQLANIWHNEYYQYLEICVTYMQPG